MTIITKPMLAGKFENFNEEIQHVEFPVLATPKFDGIRALVIDGKLVSRTFKPIKNAHIRKLIERDLPNNIDGELMDEDFQKTTSSVMSEDGEPKFTYYIFDYVKDDLSKPYKERMKDLEKLKLPDYCNKVLPVSIEDPTHLNEVEEEFINRGFEGIMIRSPKSPYKCGRGTLKACDLLKIKRFVDAEAIVLDFEEQMQNNNTAEKDNFGRTKRSSAKDGLSGKGTLGAWVVKGINGQFKDVEFRLGTAKGVTQESRQEWWDNRKELIGKVVKYKYQDIGSVDAPRIPVFLGFRDREDM